MERQTINLGFKKLHPDAKLPTYGSKEAACFDFYALENILLHAKEKKLIKTGLAVNIPFGFEIQVRPRSGVSSKTDLRICNAPGTIDSDYSGQIMIIIENTGNNDYLIKQYDRIAQGKISPVYFANIFEVTELRKTDREFGGMGSTGR